MSRERDEAMLGRQTIDFLREWPAHEVVRSALDRFPDCQFYVTGGLVRNIVLGRSHETRDVDFVFYGSQADALVNFLGGFGRVDKGQFGSPRWFPDSLPGQYCDLVPPSNFNVGLWPCEDILDILNQVDFTGDAIAIDLRTGSTINPQNGLRDLQRRQMRATRFDETDGFIPSNRKLSRLAVLWFRVLHYAHALDLTIEPLTLRWLKANRHLMAYGDDFARTFFVVHADALAALDR
jgi:hypothetical protein